MNQTGTTRETNGEPRGMDELLTELEQAFAVYRQDLERYEKKKNPLGGLFGVGSSLKDDSCHDRLDERLEKTVADMCAIPPSAEDAARAVRMLLHPQEGRAWPLAAEWMLRAVERHTLPLIPFLTPEAAAGFLRDYTSRYKPWDRLPAQKEVCRALKNKAVGKRQ